MLIIILKKLLIINVGSHRNFLMCCNIVNAIPPRRRLQYSRKHNVSSLNFVIQMYCLLYVTQFFPSTQYTQNNFSKLFPIPMFPCLTSHFPPPMSCFSTDKPVIPHYKFSVCITKYTYREYQMSVVRYKSFANILTPAFHVTKIYSLQALFKQRGRVADDSYENVILGFTL